MSTDMRSRVAETIAEESTVRVCAKCGATDDQVEFIKERPQRRPVCRSCDNRQQREDRYRRRGSRRRVGEVEEYTCSNCGATATRIVVPGPQKMTCDECLRAASNARSRAKWREGYLRRTYGISIERYEEMVAKQRGCCAICGTSDPGGRHGDFVVDHDHHTGAVRSLLCSNCNAGIGLLGEDITVMTSAISYLRRHSQRTAV